MASTASSSTTAAVINTTTTTTNDDNDEMAALPPAVQQVVVDKQHKNKNSVVVPPNNNNNIIVTTSARRQIPTHATNHFVRLTLADVHLRREQLPFCYFFEERLDPDLLEASLQSVLKHFPILGGTASRDGYLSIQCRDTDHVPLSFGTINMSLADWLKEEEVGNEDVQHHQQHHQRDHVYRTGEHPTLLPLFDSIFLNNNNNNYDDHDDDDTTRNSINTDLLAAVRVTYFECGGTAIGVNTSHILGDTASCVRFVQCWGKEMRGKKYPRGGGASSSCRLRQKEHERKRATTSVMMTEELAEIMSYGSSNNNNKSLEAPGILSKLLSAFHDKFQFAEEETNDDGETQYLPDAEEGIIGHEYARLTFPPEVLVAMKAHGMMTSQKTHDADSYVSTNDMVTAFGWLVKRAISGLEDWDLSVVVNIRGRFGVDDFSDMTRMNHSNNKEETGVFGNGITNVIANFRSTQSIFDLNDVSQAAMSIRLALHQGNSDIPDRISQSRMGRDSTAPRSYSSFATTSWAQFPVWTIKFSPLSGLVGFHGHPAHPLPMGRTFSSVIMSTPDEGCIYKLLLPRDKAKEVRALHQVMCACYLEWYAAHMVSSITPVEVDHAAAH
jgi:hypothetical protein